MDSSIQIASGDGTNSLHASLFQAAIAQQVRNSAVNGNADATFLSMSYFPL